jgi:hypothetical protein
VSQIVFGLREENSEILGKTYIVLIPADPVMILLKL